MHLSGGLREFWVAWYCTEMKRVCTLGLDLSTLLLLLSCDA